MPELAYRPAALDDAAEIFAVMEEVAAEIPVLIDTLQRQEALYAAIRHCARSGQSWVALAAGRIVGFLLVEPNEVGRFFAEREVLDLRYVGVGKAHRGRGISHDLINRVRARMVPLTATVMDANRSQMPRRLEQLGFRLTNARLGEQQFWWEPGANG